MRDNLCCCVCLKEEPFDNNPIINCDGRSCNTSVHKNCYGIQQIPDGAWFCQKCISQERSARVRCELCPSREGALKHTNKGGWCHIICALFISGVEFLDPERLETISIDKIATEKFNKVCSICEKNSRLDRASIGACIQCIKSGCKVMFHVTCAQTQGLLTQTISNKVVRYVAYCSMHKHKTRHRDFTICLSTSLHSPGKYEKSKLRQTPPQLEKSDEDCIPTVSSELSSSETDKPDENVFNRNNVSTSTSNTSRRTSHDISSSSGNEFNRFSSSITTSNSNITSFEEPSAPEISTGTVPDKYENISSAGDTDDISSTKQSIKSVTPMSKSSISVPQTKTNNYNTETSPIIDVTTTDIPLLLPPNSTSTPVKLRSHRNLTDNNESSSGLPTTPSNNKSISSPISTSSLSTIPATSNNAHCVNLNATPSIATSKASSNTSGHKRTAKASSLNSDNNSTTLNKDSIPPPAKKEKVIKKEKKEESNKSEKVRRVRRSSGKGNTDKCGGSKLAELLKSRQNSGSKKHVLPGRPKSLLQCSPLLNTSKNNKDASNLISNTNSINATINNQILSSNSLSTPNSSNLICSSTSNNNASQSVINTNSTAQQPPSSNNNACQTMQELLEWQWDQAGSVLMQQASDSDSDIASLLSCLHDLKNENEQLVSKKLKLSHRRDHLKVVNAKLEMQLLSKQAQANQPSSNTSVTHNSNTTNTTVTTTNKSTSSSSSTRKYSNNFYNNQLNSNKNNQPLQSNKIPISNNTISVANNNLTSKAPHLAQHQTGSVINPINSIIIPTTGFFTASTTPHINGTNTPLLHNNNNSNNNLIYSHPFPTSQPTQSYITSQPITQQIFSYTKPNTIPVSNPGSGSAADLVTQLFNQQLQSQFAAAAVTQQQFPVPQHQIQPTDLVSLIPPPPPSASSTSSSSSSHTATPISTNHNSNMELLYHAINKKQQLQHKQHNHKYTLNTTTTTPNNNSSNSLANSVLIPQIKIPNIIGNSSNSTIDNSNTVNFNAMNFNIDNQTLTEKTLARLANNIKLAKKNT